MSGYDGNARSGFQITRNISSDEFDVDKIMGEILPRPKDWSMTISSNFPAPGHPDGDHTTKALEIGTTMCVDGSGFYHQIVPVTKMYVKDEVMYVEGTVFLSENEETQETNNE